MLFSLINSPLVRLLLRKDLLQSSVELEAIKSREYEPLLTLAENGLVDEEQAIKAVANELDIEYLDLLDYDKFSALRDYSFPQVDPQKWWEWKAVVVENENDFAKVALANPLNQDTLSSIEFAIGKRAIPVIAPEKGIRRALQRLYPTDVVSFDLLPDQEESFVEILSSTDEDDLRSSDVERAPIIKLVNKIISDAVDSEASDIHFEPSSYGLDVRYRIDGIMQPIIEIPKRVQPYIISRVKLLADMDIAVKRRPQDGRFRVRLSKDRVDFRVSSVPTSNGEKLVLRVLCADASNLKFSKIGIRDDVITSLKKALANKGKLILVTGPTGSGKTTTLYSCLNYLRDGTSNIETVENPIEYRLQGISQIQVNELAGVTFASALRSILRQDPDIIMVGEIRDIETAEIALQAAQTGHTVLSTLHTNDAVSAVSRLMDLGCEPYLIASSLQLVIAQRLVRSLCPKCSRLMNDEEVKEDKELIAKYDFKRTSLRTSNGCRACFRTGYRGRLGVFSAMDITDELSAKIAEKATQSELIQSAKKAGYISLEQAAADLIRAGQTSIEEVRAFLQVEDTARGPVRPTASMVEAVSETPSVRDRSSISKDKVLLVEDDENVRAVLEQVLKLEMYNVVSAENGQEALELVFDEKPDLILLDYMMPVMDGKEFLTRLKSNQSTDNIPVIMLTAANSESNEVELLSLGARDFVGKTASRKVLLSRIRSALSKR